MYIKFDARLMLCVTQVKYNIMNNLYEANPGSSSQFIYRRPTKLLCSDALICL